MTSRERAWLAGAVLASFLVHLALVMRGFGEGDAARLAVQALVWHEHGEPTILTYTVRVSTLYLLALRGLLESGVAPEALPAWMNLTNVVTGSLVWWPLYTLWRSVQGSGVAAAACALFAVTPAFWHANHYGMPHVPAFLFFLLHLVCVLRWLRASGAAFFAWLAVGVLCACVALGLKADMVLAFGAPFGLALALRRLSIRNVLAAGVAPLVALFFVTRLAVTAVPGLEALDHHASSWSDRFPLTWDAILNPNNVVVPAFGAGAVLFGAMVLALFVAVASSRTRRLALWALCWSTPALLFWGLREGNSARHMMAIYPPLCLLVASVAKPRLSSRGRAVAALLALVSVNYFAAPAYSRTFRMGGRLFEGRARVQADVDTVVERAAEFTALRAPKKVLGGTWTLPYVTWHVLLASDRYRVAWGARGAPDQWADIQLETYVGGERELVQLVISRNTLYTPPGATVWTAQDELEVFTHPGPSGRPR